MGQATFSHTAVLVVINAGVALLYAAQVYYYRDKRPYFRAQLITLLVMAIILLAVASFYFMDLLDESWTWSFLADSIFGFGLLNVLIELRNRFPDASRRQRLLLVLAIGILVIVVSAFCFLNVIKVCLY